MAHIYKKMVRQSIISSLLLQGLSEEQAKHQLKIFEDEAKNCLKKAIKEFRKE